MRSFSGFPDNSRYTPVPNLLFGPLLEEIDDVGVLKCLLRTIWLHSQKKGFPRFLTWEDLVADTILAKALSGGDASHAADLKATLDKAVQLNALIHLGVEAARGMVDVYMPNTQEGRRAAQHLGGHKLDGGVAYQTEALPSPVSRPNIFTLYEENIGIITPIIAEELKEAEDSYPEEWVEEAFRESVLRNRRSWHYIEAILKGWATEGREYGESGGRSKKVDSRDWIRRHGLPRSSR